MIATAIPARARAMKAGGMHWREVANALAVDHGALIAALFPAPIPRGVQRAPIKSPPIDRRKKGVRVVEMRDRRR